MLYLYITLHEPFSRSIALVYGLGVLDTLQSAMLAADAFHWFVFGFGNLNQLDQSFLNPWDVQLFDAVISLIAQGFYCWRIYILRQNSLIFPVLILAVCSVPLFGKLLSLYSVDLNDAMWCWSCGCSHCE